MREANVINLDVNERIDKVIYEAIDIYVNKLMSGFIEVGLEATFQLHLARIIEDLLQTHTYVIDERFQVILEKNIPINEKKNYVDIIIKYTKNEIEKLYPFELKFKKQTDSAQDTGHIQSYKDMYNLDYLHQHTSYVNGCYFIFLTDDISYTKIPRQGTTRDLLPMHDGAVIEANKSYNVMGPAAKSIMDQFVDTGFTLSSSHTINYNTFSINNKKYFYFVEKF